MDVPQDLSRPQDSLKTQDCTQDCKAGTRLDDGYRRDKRFHTMAVELWRWICSSIDLSHKKTV